MAEPYDVSGLASTLFTIGGTGVVLGMLGGLGRSMTRMSDRMINDDYWGRRPYVQRQRSYRSLIYEPRRQPERYLYRPKKMPYISIPATRLRRSSIRW